jgi:chromosome segregation ATPase
MALSNVDLVLMAATGLSWLVAGGVALRARSARPDEANDAAEQPLEQVTDPDAQLQERLTQLQAEATKSADDLKQQLAAKTAEADDAREEAELILLQLHQVQEELEHYFLLSRDLEAQLEQAKAAAPESNPSAVQPNLDLAPLHADLARIKERLQAALQQPEPLPSTQLWSLVRRQQALLTRFQAMHATPAPAAQRASAALDADVVLL